jgi:UDP-N-acetylglucosamine 2-epimerase (non-hydrolysing)
MISIFYGTRPEYIKLHKLYNELKSNKFICEFVKVQQHTTLIDSCEFDRCINVKSGNNRLNTIVQNCLKNNIFEKNTKLVIVQGDTATAFAVALNAFNSKIPVAHIEAGLRTWDNDNPYPEETYRRCISSIADLHFCVSELNKKTLLTEKVNGKVYVVGNTVLDNLNIDGIEYGNVVPITLHRRENRHQIEQLLIELDFFVEKYKHLKFVYLKHPAVDIKYNFKNIIVVPPLNYNDMIDMIKKCKFIITDSGGIQEEASFLKKKTLVVRKETERSEGLGTFSFLSPDIESIKNGICRLDKYYEIDEPCPYGDGNAVTNIVKVLRNLYQDENI